MIPEIIATATLCLITIGNWICSHVWLILIIYIAWIMGINYLDHMIHKTKEH